MSVFTYTEVAVGHRFFGPAATSWHRAQPGRRVSVLRRQSNSNTDGGTGPRGEGHQWSLARHSLSPLKC